MGELSLTLVYAPQTVILGLTKITFSTKPKKKKGWLAERKKRRKKEKKGVHKIKKKEGGSE